MLLLLVLLLQTLLLPTPFNISPIYVSRDDLLAFVEAQQYGAAHLGISLPLLTGTFLLVPSAQLEAPAFSSGSNDRTTSSGSGNSTFSAAIPWRLRQVLAVVPAPSRDPADATVVLVGGQRVTAGAVRDGQLAEMPDHEVRGMLTACSEFIVRIGPCVPQCGQPELKQLVDAKGRPNLADRVAVHGSRCSTVATSGAVKFTEQYKCLVQLVAAHQLCTVWH
jgi:hypothetical protein